MSLLTGEGKVNVNAFVEARATKKKNQNGNGGNMNTTNGPKGNTKDPMTTDINTLIRWVDEVVEYKNDPRNLKQVIYDSLPTVSNVVTKRDNESTNSEMKSAINKSIAVLAIGNVPNVLVGCLREGDMDVANICYMISKLINIDDDSISISDDVIDTYVNDILYPINETSVKHLSSQTGITNDLSLELLVAYPINPTEMSGIFIAKTYPRFLARIFDHAQDNSDVLGRDTLADVFDYIFGDGYIKIANKVIGQYLVNCPVMPNDGNKLEETIFNEFFTMLYEKLNSYSDTVIDSTISFIMSKLSNDSLFDRAYAEQFENIRNALERYESSPKNNRNNNFNNFQRRQTPRISLSSVMNDRR